MYKRSETSLDIYPSIHPSILFLLFWIGSRWQQDKQRIPDIPLQGNTFQLLLGGPKARQGIYYPSSEFCVSFIFLIGLCFSFHFMPIAFPDVLQHQQRLTILLTLRTHNFQQPPFMWGSLNMSEYNWQESLKKHDYYPMACIALSIQCLLDTPGTAQNRDNKVQVTVRWLPREPENCGYQTHELALWVMDL